MPFSFNNIQGTPSLRLSPLHHFILCFKAVDRVKKKIKKGKKKKKKGKKEEKKKHGGLIGIYALSPSIALSTARQLNNYGSFLFARVEEK